jgi:hypothetical protein
VSIETGPADREARRLPTALLALGFALWAVAGVLAGLLEVTLIPLRDGTALIPIAPVLTVLTGVLLPAIARSLTDSMAAAAPPAIGQLLTIWFLATGRPEGDVLMPAGGTSWVSYGVLILGTLVPLSMLGFASRHGRWRWPRRRSDPAHRPGRLSRPRPPARHGSGSGGAG